MKGMKVVTELDPVTYDRLRDLADRRALSLKAVVREAVLSQLVAQGGPMDDPIFQMVGRLKLKGRNWSQRKDSRP